MFARAKLMLCLTPTPSAWARSILTHADGVAVENLSLARAKNCSPWDLRLDDGLRGLTLSRQ